MFSRQVIAHGRSGDALLGAVDERQLAQRPARAGRGAQARPAHDRLRGLRRRRRRCAGPGRPRVVTPLGAHPAHPGGAGQRLPRAARAGRAGPIAASAAAPPSAPRGRRVRGHGCEGTVQGVGLPPVRLPSGARARPGGLTVLNDERGVLRRGRGDAGGGRATSCSGCAPRRRRWPTVARRRLARSSRPTGAAGFAIAASERYRAGRRRRSRPTAPRARTAWPSCCDPGDRRHRYPFVNCTNCGPRFTIVRRRPLRPAADDDGRLRHVPGVPGGVRRSARPALPRPAQRVPGVRAARARAHGRDRRPRRQRGRRPLAAAAALLAGRDPRVKGLGGYHLACRADDEAAVGTLRARKHREDRPFALLVRRRGRGARRSCRFLAPRRRC